jgi:WD40 repeat protein
MWNGVRDGSCRCTDHRKAARQCLGVGHSVSLETGGENEQIGVDIIKRACEEPARQISGNAGFEGAIVIGKLRENSAFGFGWNAQTGELLKDWIVGRETRVEFAPDSRELVVARGGDFHFLNVGTLETSRRLKREIGLYPGDVAFCPDGKLMAMEMSPAVIHLKETSTGRTVAQLEDPSGDRSNMISFSHEGTRLIVLSSYASAIHVWDLRAIRSRLKAMGLDWEWPEFRQ